MATCFPDTAPVLPSLTLLRISTAGRAGNPGPAGYGVFITDHTGRKVAELCHYLGHETNNVAEYHGLLAALRFAMERGEKALSVVSDSELLVRQMKGIYKVKNQDCAGSTTRRS